MNFHSPLSWKKPFVRAASRLKRGASGVSRRTLDDSSSFTTYRTHSNSSTAHTRMSLDLAGNCSEDSTTSDCTKSPGSTASPGTLKRKKLRKREIAKAPSAPDLSTATPTRESLDDGDKRTRRRGSKKGGGGDCISQQDSTPRKPSKDLESPRKSKSKKILSKDPPGTKSIIKVDRLEEQVVEEAPLEVKARSKTAKAKTKKKKKKSAITADGEAKKKKSKTKKSACKKKSKEVVADENIESTDQGELRKSLRSLTSSGSFSLNGSTRDLGNASVCSEAGVTCIHAEMDMDINTSQSERSWPRRSMPLHHRSSSLKPCLRKTSLEEPSFLDLGASAPSFPLTDDGDQSTSSQEFILPLSGSAVKLGDFIQSQRPPSFDPFEGLGEPKCDRHTISGGSVDLADLFGAISLDGTRSIDESFDFDLSGSRNRSRSYHGSQRARSASPGCLAGRKKALIGDWTAPVDASEHWSSCHERRSLDGMSIPDIMSSSYHGSISVTTRSRTKSNRVDLDKSKGESSIWNSSDDIDLQSGHSGIDISLCDEVEFDEEEEFADDLFDSDIDDDLSDDDLKGDDDDILPPAWNKAGQERYLQRQVSDTSFDEPCSDDERAAFEGGEDEGCSYHEKRSMDGSIVPRSVASDDPDEGSSSPFEILQMTPRTKTKFMTKRKKLAMAAAATASLD